MWSFTLISLIISNSGVFLLKPIKGQPPLNGSSVQDNKDFIAVSRKSHKVVVVIGNIYVHT